MGRERDDVEVVRADRFIWTAIMISGLQMPVSRSVIPDGRGISRCVLRQIQIATIFLDPWKIKPGTQ